MNIPYKIGKATTVILHNEEEKAVKDLAMQLLEKTGTYSQSEAVRMLIRAGAAVLKNDV